MDSGRVCLGLTAALGSLRIDVDRSWSGRLFADDRNTDHHAGWGAGITGANVRWAGSGIWQAFASARNLFNRPYVAAVVVNGFGGRVIEPGPGRTLTVGVEVRLDP